MSLDCYINHKKKSLDKSIKTKHKISTKKIQAVKDFNFPEKEGEELKLITTKGINTAYLLKRLSDENGIIKNAKIAMFRINLWGVNFFKDLFDQGKIRRADFILTTLLLTKKDYDIVTALKNMKNKYNITVNFCVTHTKVAAFEFENREYYTIDGSGSLTENARVEQYNICKSKQVYNFHAEWIDTITDNLKGVKNIDECK